ncbi:neuronal acetylcholine receptor subunit alpha-9-like [Palaemon carinicauda]|uniref:neuronal acetylcholine receptor subunit alpha-9-like n=1 Tax=Palaemon carinicauda TaxID=392227 RepID=UPI0035B653EE
MTGEINTRVSEWHTQLNSSRSSISEAPNKQVLGTKSSKHTGPPVAHTICKEKVNQVKSKAGKSDNMSAFYQTKKQSGYSAETESADSQYTSATINTNVIVTSAGEVTWLSHGIYRSSCDMNVEHFPFDTQSCKMKWASWNYLDLMKQMDEGDMPNYQSNGEFGLVEFTAMKNITYYSCCPEPYPDITFTIKLRRRPMFYVFNLILPCVLINGIALLVFYVPSKYGEKVTLGITALLSMTVFLMTIRESLPPTEKTPLISMYYGVTICLVSFASGMSVLTLNIHHRGVRGTEVPHIIKKIVLGGLSKLVFLLFETPVMAQEEKNVLLNNLYTLSVA